MSYDEYRGPPRPHPTHYRYPQDHRQFNEHEHYPEVIVQTNNGTPVTKINMPILFVIPLVLFVATSVSLVVSNFSEIKSSLASLSNKIERLAGDLGGRIDRVELEARQRSQDRYTKTQHDLFCARTEQVNSSIGWKCGDVEESSLKYRFSPRGIK